jgi:crotonobetainyl-CoA:carnitine CoA-transferase CaiB-like acyl-CoA transferase
MRQGVYMLGFDLNVALDWGRAAPLVDRRSAPNPVVNNYTTRDGRMLWLVGIASDRHFPPLARALGHPEWLDDERFATERARFKNREGLIAVLDDVFGDLDLDDVTRAFAAEPDVFWAPVNTIEDVLADPQLRPGGGVVEVPERDGVTTRTMVATPVDFSRTAWRPRRVAPDVGEHTREVLAALGRSEAEIDDLVARGVIGAQGPLGRI